MQTVRPFGKTHSDLESVQRRRAEAGQALARRSELRSFDADHTEIVARLWVPPPPTRASGLRSATLWKWATLAAAAVLATMVAALVLSLR